MNKETLKALELYKKDLINLREKALKKREKELSKTIKINAELEETTEQDLEDLYAVGCISEKQYDKKLEQLRDYKENKNKDKPTAITEYLRILDNEIWSLGEEIKQG